jgi:hypothetical protein
MVAKSDVNTVRAYRVNIYNKEGLFLPCRVVLLI